MLKIYDAQREISPGVKNENKRAFETNDKQYGNNCNEPTAFEIECRKEWEEKEEAVGCGEHAAVGRKREPNQMREKGSFENAHARTKERQRGILAAQRLNVGEN